MFPIPAGRRAGATSSRIQRRVQWLLFVAALGVYTGSDGFADTVSKTPSPLMPRPSQPPPLPLSNSPRRVVQSSLSPPPQMQLHSPLYPPPALAPLPPQQPPPPRWQPPPPVLLQPQPPPLPPVLLQHLPPPSSRPPASQPLDNTSAAFGLEGQPDEIHRFKLRGVRLMVMVVFLAFGAGGMLLLCLFQMHMPESFARMKAVMVNNMVVEDSGDYMECGQLIIKLCVGMYSMTVGCLLAIFVPQSCPPNCYDPVAAFCAADAFNPAGIEAAPALGGPDLPQCVKGPTACSGLPCVPFVHTCTLQENVTDLSPMDKLVIGFNFCTLCCAVLSMVMHAYREHCIIQMFDFDPERGLQDWSREIAMYPKFEKRLRRLNRLCETGAYAMIAILVANFAITAAVILQTYYTGRASIMGLLSSSLLVMPRYLREAWLIRSANKKDTAVSMFAAVPKAYNKIDDDFTVQGKRSKTRKNEPATESRSAAMAGYALTKASPDGRQPVMTANSRPT